ncbi:MAG: hypothetical protein ACYS4W_01495 [Planctomycetota bacterium]|jgi:hypothetical protein
MPLPSEYVIEDAVRSIDDVIVYRANHPIHGVVNVYLPDRTLPPGLSRAVKKRLYQNGLKMRNLSLLNVPRVTKALEVSQNPNEPYIVTKHRKYDLDDLISNGVTLKPKRMFSILSQVLEAILNLGANGWVVERPHARQVKLAELGTGDIGFNVIEGAEQRFDVTEIATVSGDDVSGDIGAKAAPSRDAGEDSAAVPTMKITQSVDAVQTGEGTASIRVSQRPDEDETVTLEDPPGISDAERQRRARRRNIYLLGNTAYQLLFGRKYQSSDKVAVACIRKLGRRWRRVLEKALSDDIERRYDTYEGARRDVRRALNRNRRAAVASVPFLLVLLLIGSYFGYERYRRHKIMTSEAGQAIESFLEIVNKTNDDFPEIKKPEEPPVAVDEQAILSPFNEVGAVEEANQNP